jgi:hypothetical protein
MGKCHRYFAPYSFPFISLRKVRDGGVLCVYDAERMSDWRSHSDFNSDDHHSQLGQSNTQQNHSLLPFSLLHATDTLVTYTVLKWQHVVTDV